MKKNKEKRDAYAIVAKILTKPETADRLLKRLLEEEKRIRRRK